MPTNYSMRPLAPLGLLTLCIIAFSFVGCGAASTGGNVTKGSTATVVPAPISVKGYGTANGCPSDMVVNAVPTKANVILQPSDVNTTIAAHNGDVIEVRLPFGHKWGGPAASQGILQLQPPAGYALKTSNVCIWRFVAQGTGSAFLDFSGRPICKRGQMCPLFIMNVPFKISVK
jgi:hypothetical protein